METFPPILKNKWKRFHLSSLYYLLFVLSTLFRKKFTQAKKYMEFSIILLILYSNLGTVACAWHRRVRRSFAPKNCSLRSHFFGDPIFAPPQPSTRHGKTTGLARKTKEKARRRGAVPADPLGDRLPLLPPRMAFFHWFYSCDMYLLNFAFSGRLW